MSIHRSIAALLIAAIIVPTALLATPERAESQAGGVASCAALFGLGAGSSALGTAASAVGLTVPVNDAGVAANTAAEVQKECLDSIAFSLAKIAIKSISDSVINWINRGFDGGPAFVTDLDQFLYEIDAQTFEEFLGSDAIAYLCTPWKFDLQLQLETQFGRTTGIQCSLGDAVDNIDQFLAGDFSQGGLDGWFQLSTRNNPYRDYLTLESEYRGQIAATRFTSADLPLDFGRGFLSWEECTSRPARPGDPGASAGPGSMVEECETTTPGAVIESQLENVLGSGIRQLELADEINEIVETLIAQLVYQALSEGLGNL